MSDEPKRVENLMLRRLGNIYGEPDVPNPAGFMEEFARQLQGFTDSELHAATDHIIRKRSKIKRAWPTIGECLTACEVARSNKLAKMRVESMQLQRKANEHKKMEDMSEEEKQAYYDFVDAAADGQIDLGLCAASLRKMAITMRDRRRRGSP